MVKCLTTYYCEACATAYDTYEDAASCEQSARPALQRGDVILRSARGGQGFKPESGGLVWGVVEQIREQAGVQGAPVHQYFYTTSGMRKEISEAQLMLPGNGRLSLERGITEGPGHTRQLTYLMDSFPLVRAQMAECLALLSRCAGIAELTPEEYAKWDDLRYTAYDFGQVAGDSPIQVPPSILHLLAWSAVPKAPGAVHQSLFFKPELGLHGGAPTYAPFDDNVGVRTKWLIGRGDAYRYLRFHMQPVWQQIEEIGELQSQLRAGQPVWVDNLADLFVPDTSPGTPLPKELLLEYPDLNDSKISVVECKRVIFDRILSEQERWRRDVTVENTIIPADIPVLAVAAGKGGVGKSTVAAQIARSAVRRGLKPLFLDLDFYGPSAPTEFNLHDMLRIENGFIVPHQCDGVKVVSIGNMIDEDTALHWRGPVLEAFIHLLTAHIQYDDVDLILLDCPPGTGDVQLGMMNRIRPQATVLVTTASELALADVRRAAASFHAGDAQVYGVIENMSSIRMVDGREKRLFGTPDRVSHFCSNAGLNYLGQVPFVDSKDEFTDIFDQLAEPLFALLSLD